MVGGVPAVWGATAAEVERGYPADVVLGVPVIALTRAVTVNAPAALAYRWLCQVRLAPYSYDLLDNLGRRSPQELTPGADDLAVGDEVMVFELVDVAPGREWTGVIQPRAARLFGPIAATYAVDPVDPRTSRLICRIVLARPRGLGRLRAFVLGWGDLMMMRKQLLTLRDLAERDARRAAPAPAD